MPGRDTTTGTLPTSTVLEKERLGGDDRAAVGTGLDISGAVLGIEEGGGSGGFS